MIFERIFTDSLLEVVLISVSIYIVLKTIKSRRNSFVAKTYFNFSVSNLLFVLSYFFSCLYRYQICFNDNLSGFIIYFCLLVTLGIGSCSWFIYVSSAIGLKFTESRTKILLSTIPIIIYILLCISSYWTELIFYIDAEGVYQLGSLWYLQYLFCFGYCAIAMVCSAVNYFKVKIRRDIDRVLFLTMMIDLVAVILQFYLQNNLMHVAMTFTVLLSYLNTYSIQMLKFEEMQEKNRKDMLEQAEAHRLLQENNARIFALEDDFESLYDVQLETGNYISYIKRDSYQKNVAARFVTSSDYFSDLRENIDTCIYPEDREELYSTLTREAIREELKDKDHFDYYYRLMIEGKPIWYKVRVVYKDSDKTNVIIGAFNAENEEEVKQLVEQKAKLEESLAFTNYFFSTYTSAYYFNLDTLKYKVYKEPVSFFGIERMSTEQLLKKLYDRIYCSVYPDDIDRLLELVTPQKVKELLRTHPEYSYTFRDISGDEIHYMKLQIIRGGDECHAAFGFADVTNEIIEQQNRMKDAEEARKLIESAASLYDVAYAVNMVDDSYKTLKVGGNILFNGDKFKNYSEAREELLGLVHEADKKRMRNELSYDVIREKLKERNSYSIEFRMVVNNATSWHEMVATLIDEDHAALGFTEKDMELIEQHLEGKRYEEYFALFVVDLDTEMLRIVKNEENYKPAQVGESVPYSPFVINLAKNLDTETQAFFLQISDLDYVRSEFETDDKRTYSYKAMLMSGEKAWVEASAYIILRNDDGSPAMMTLGFSIVDAFATIRQETQSRLTEDMQMIGGLASGYHALYYYNMNDGLFRVYSLDGKKLPKAAAIVEGGGDPVEIFRNFVESELVHPDDRKLFSKLNIEEVRSRLAHTKKLTIRFRRNFNGVYRWTEMDIIKYEAIDEAPNIIALGFADRDDEIRAEQEQQKQLRNDLDIIKVLAEEYGSVYYADLETENVTPYSMDESTRKGTEEMFKKSNNYTEVFSAYVEHFVYEPDKEMMLREGKKESICEKLSQSDSSTITFRLYLNGHIHFCEMKYVAARRENGELKSIVIGFAHKDEEIMAQYINEKLVGEYISAFLVDLDADKFRTYRHPDTTKAMDREDRTWSLAMTDFAAECDSEYYEIVKNIGTPEFLKRELADVDRREYTYRFPSNTKPWRRSVVQVIDRKDGIPCNVVATFMGIDDYQSKINDQQKQLEEQKEELEIARDEAEAASRSKTNFLFNMSHDIRTPMNAITGFTNMAIKHIDDKNKVLDCLDKTQKAGNMLLSLINSVLEVSRIESGKATPEQQCGDVYYCFANIENTMQELAKSKDISLSFEFGEIRNRYVLADFSRCMRIFVNVISNAIKYTPECGFVKVRCEQTEDTEDGYANYRYSVTDNGIGMSEEFQKHVFEQFSREQTATVSGIQGSGLGMAVVKSFVDLLGGKISVNSKLNMGTTFIIDLPFKIQEGEEYTDPVSGELISSFPRAESSAVIDLRGKRILLVEDNELNREIAIDILEEQDIIVEYADDGTTAVEKMKEKGPDYYDLILMDIQMPIMNGYTATREIRKMYPDNHFPIIALSANAFAEDKEASLAAGMDDHVAKPIKSKDLFEVISRYLK